MALLRYACYAHEVLRPGSLMHGWRFAHSQKLLS